MKPGWALWCGPVWPRVAFSTSETRGEEQLQYLHKKRRLENLICAARPDCGCLDWRAQFTEIKRPGINIIH